MQQLDKLALRGWPLPHADDASDKEERGQVLVVAGSREFRVPPCYRRLRRCVPARASTNRRGAGVVVAEPEKHADGADGLAGFLGYGMSLVLFGVALRTLGAARTGACFSVAPLFGVLISLAIWPGAPGLLSWISAVLMGLGVWLHLSERHAHQHTHEPLSHSHPHPHDAHHPHAHDAAWEGQGSSPMRIPTGIRTELPGSALRAL